MDTIRAFFSKIRTLFSNFWKRAGETSTLPPLVTRLYRHHFWQKYLSMKDKWLRIWKKILWYEYQLCRMMWSFHYGFFVLRKCPHESVILSNLLLVFFENPFLKKGAYPEVYLGACQTSTSNFFVWKLLLEAPS